MLAVVQSDSIHRDSSMISDAHVSMASPGGSTVVGSAVAATSASPGGDGSASQQQLDTGAQDDDNGSVGSGSSSGSGSRSGSRSGSDNGEDQMIEVDLPAGDVPAAGDAILRGDSWEIRGGISAGRSGSFASIALPHESEPLRGVLHDTSGQHRGNTEMRYVADSEVGGEVVLTSGGVQITRGCVVPVPAPRCRHPAVWWHAPFAGPCEPPKD